MISPFKYSGGPSPVCNIHIKLNAATEKSILRMAFCGSNPSNLLLITRF